MAPQFVRFVRAVDGRLVSRWDVGPAQYFGARLGTPEERAAGKAIVWDTEAVTPLTAEFVARFPRELSKALRHGDLVEAKAKDYAAWLAVEQTRDEAAQAALAQATPAPAPAPTPPPGPPPPTQDATPAKPASAPADTASAPAAQATEEKAEKRK